MDLLEINKRLIGEVTPIGESTKDRKRLQNLKTQIELVLSLAHGIIEVSKLENDSRNSIREAGIMANHYLDYIQEQLDSIPPPKPSFPENR